MRYVIYNVYYAANAPKAAEELITFIRKAYGSEFNEINFPDFAKKMSELAESANKGKAKIKYGLSTFEKNGVKSGEYKYYVESSTWGERDIARLNYIIVDKKWGTEKGVFLMHTTKEWNAIRLAEIEEKRKSIF